MLGVADYSKVGEELGCKEGTALGVSVWYIEGITEGIVIESIEGCLECS